MVHALHFTVKSDIFHDLYDKLLILFLSSGIFGWFSLMSLAAARIREIASEIAAKAWIMPPARGNSCFNQLRFAMFAEKEVTLTMWGITPIRKNFIFGVIGAIFTYTLMFYSLNIGNNSGT
ncbi:hypothetical protein NPIL_508861 [Nephila pilipes]|uniref:Uncharacterized protein n=1 Tax=Nephila pilipes TaxID=299642 RepID=A0A8X6IK48_NEPPI|nr:hypothetical protein NPIL_508861 [Nephila pilipes]